MCQLIALKQELKLPRRRIIINGKIYDCLCDTGACRTVLVTAPPNISYSKTAVLVKTAGGQTESHQLTNPVLIRDDETGTQCKLKVLISPSCPVNLLGRDLMIQLGISVIATPHGMRAVMAEGTHVVQGMTCPQYYWSLDLGQTPQARELLRQTRVKQRGHKVQYMPDDGLHVTMWYKPALGPDPKYDRQFHAQGEVCLTIQHLYVDLKHGYSAASVLLEPKQLKLFRGRTPHISLSKLSGDKWHDLELFVSNAVRRGTHYRPEPGTEWKRDKQTDVWQLPLGWRVKVTPVTHMEDNE